MLELCVTDTPSLMQDGAGRIGKMLFARHGKKFDCDLKQVLNFSTCLKRMH